MKSFGDTLILMSAFIADPAADRRAFADRRVLHLGTLPGLPASALPTGCRRLPAPQRRLAAARLRRADPRPGNDNLADIVAADRDLGKETNQ